MLQTELVARKITLVEELAPDLPEVHVAASKISQVVVNLIKNATQAMPDGGLIEIRSSLTKVRNAQPEAGLREFDRFRDGDPVVVIEIRDHGCGIPEELMNRVFEPFFTTKPTGEGAGLGLSLSKKIVELHRGRLEIFNVTNPGGLCARIHLKALSDSYSG
jgi:signal transduction histidine kinase